MSEEQLPSTLAELQTENIRLRRAVEELSVLNGISGAISSMMSVDSIVEMIVQESVKYLNVEQGAVMLLRNEEDTDPFRTVARKAYSGSDAVPFRFGQQLTGWMLKNQKPLLINDLKSDARFRNIASPDFAIESLLSVPLKAKGEMVGLLNVFNKRSEEGFTVDDQRLLSIIASQSAQIVENVRLYEELQRRSDELQESEAKYRALTQEAGEAILLADFGSRRILEVNDKVEPLTGLSRRLLRGRTLADVIPVSEWADHNTFEAMSNGSHLSYANVKLGDNGGPTRFIDVSATLVSYGEHKIIQVICHDVTERQKLAEHLRDHAEELEREVEARTLDLRNSQAQLVQQEKMAALGKLVAGIAHEMNTPIGTITSNADTLSRALEKMKKVMESDEVPEAVRGLRGLKQVQAVLEDIARINQLACDRIIGIVSSLRNFARLDEAELKTADLHEGIESTLTLVHHELKNRIEVIKEYGEIPPISCHPNQINQVFMNMLVNASQAIQGEGTITIRTFRQGDTVNVQFSDTGTGIPPESLSRIFDPGFTTKGVGVGTGLGLSICFKIAQDHGGGIDVESEVGKGSTFTIRLPISKNSEADASR